MRARLSILAMLALASLAAAPFAGASAVVIVAEDGGFPPDTVQTVRSLAVAELRTRGIDVEEETRTGTASSSCGSAASTRRSSSRWRTSGRRGRPPISRPPTPPRASTRPTSWCRGWSAPSSIGSRSRRGHGCRRSRPKSRPPSAAGPARASSSSASDWPRSAVRSAGATRPGTSGYGILAQGADEGASFFGVEGAWIPYDASVSPYVGAGLGSVGGHGDASVGTKLEAGVEFFRLYRVRLMAGVSAIIPFESRPGESRVSWGLSLRCGF